MHRTVSDLDRRARRRLPSGRKWRRQSGLALGCDRLHQFNRAFVGRATDVAGSDIMIVSEDPRQSAIDLDPFCPILQRSRPGLVLLRREFGIRPRRRWRSLANVVVDLAAIA